MGSLSISGTLKAASDIVQYVLLDRSDCDKDEGRDVGADLTLLLLYKLLSEG